MKPFPKTVTELLEHPEWDPYISDKLGNDLFLSDPDRADRIHEAASDGCDGSTHSEVIEDWRGFASNLYRDAMRAAYDEDGNSGEQEVDDAYEALQADILQCEEWHEKNKTLSEQIG